ncbi:NRAMP family divalent metal transporter [Azohydromonas australica]|uniref:NRAMP family divalent metal transporter n=1 Tax=Azohydromonas australica TaxID=364039 RepID=UPI0004216B79|nr:divalent metal cation transporter [Azohydromonas australica]
MASRPQLLATATDPPDGAPTQRSRFAAGLITGASDADPSGIGTYAQAGAQFGMAMLWPMGLTYPLMVAVQSICARVARVTGRGLAANLARVLPRWLLWPLLLAFFLTNAVTIGADLMIMGEAATLLLPGRAEAWAVGMGAVSVALQVAVPYSRYVRYLKWLTLSVLAYVAAAFTVNVPWDEVLRRTLVPQVQFSREYAQMLVAVLGTTICPYLFFWQSAQEVEEQRAAPDERPIRAAPQQARRQFSRSALDTGVGMAISNGIGWFIVLTTALTLHASGIRDIDTAAQAAQALQPLAGPGAFALFAAGIIGTGLLAIPVLAGSAAYALAEGLGWRRGLERRFRAARGFYLVMLLAVALGVAMTLLQVNPMRALVLTSIISGVVSVPLLVALMWTARSKQLLGGFTVGRGLQALGWFTTALLAVAAVSLAL